MKLIVGLGNIGEEYAKTNHNAGFMVVDELAERYSVNIVMTSSIPAEEASETVKKYL